jgi:hypothetical protein
VKNTTKKSQTSKHEHDDEDDDLETYPVADTPDYRSTVIYGRSNTGKTTLASTWPKPMLFLDIRDRGTDSISDVEGISVFKVESVEDFKKAYWYLKKHPKKYKTVVVDTVSQLQQVAIKERANKSGKNAAKAGEWGTMTKQDWAAVSSLMKEWLVNYRDLQDLGINVVFIAQDRVFNTEDEEDTEGNMIAPEVGPSLSPATAKFLNAAVTIIGNTYIRLRPGDKKKGRKEKIQYCLRIGPNPTYVTKMRKKRSVVIPSSIVDPTYDEVMEIIKGE